MVSDSVRRRVAAAVRRRGKTDLRIYPSIVCLVVLAFTVTAVLYITGLAGTEENRELQILGAPNLVRLEARNPNMEGAGEITIRQLIRTALRMRPDRIIVGEVRGAETIDMIQAMSTGHRGSLSTGHSDSPRDMLRRLETMVLMGMDIPLAAIQRQIASAIDIIIHVGRLRDKSRKVLEIVEVLDYADGEIQTGCLYEFQETGTGPGGTVTGKWAKKDPLSHTGKLLSAGYPAP